MKTCTKCGKSADEVKFRRKKSTKDGWSYRCVLCTPLYKNKTKPTSEKRREYTKRYEELHPEPVAQARQRSYQTLLMKRAEDKAARVQVLLEKPVDRKICSACKDEFELNAFSKQVSGPLGRRSQCRKCEAKLRKPNDPVKLRASEKVWREKNPGRVVRNTRVNQNRRRYARAVACFTGEQWKSLLDSTGHKCLCCGEPEMTSIYSFKGGPRRGRLTPDHVIPVVNGGTEDISNIQPLCLPCNMRKATKTTDYRTIAYAIAA
jgi:hypothetical protein